MHSTISIFIGTYIDVCEIDIGIFSQYFFFALLILRCIKKPWIHLVAFSDPAKSFMSSLFSNSGRIDCFIFPLEIAEVDCRETFVLLCFDTIYVKKTKLSLIFWLDLEFRYLRLVSSFVYCDCQADTPRVYMKTSFVTATLFVIFLHLTLKDWNYHV